MLTLAFLDVAFGSIALFLGAAEYIPLLRSDRLPVVKVAWWLVAAPVALPVLVLVGLSRIVNTRVELVEYGGRPYDAVARVWL